MLGLAVVFDTLPWWFAGLLLYLGLLVAGMALDETYVNRTTVLAGALALSVHSYAGGGLWVPVGLYLDLGLLVGAYGLYAYVVDAYVPDWFRILAYFAYSPLAVALVIAVPDLLFPLALVAAAYVNLQLLAYFHPVEPYYFGPPDPESVDAAVADSTPPEPRPTDGPIGSKVRPPGSTDVGATSASREFAGPVTRPETTPSGDPSSTDRGVLPGFMRRP